MRGMAGSGKTTYVLLLHCDVQGQMMLKVKQLTRHVWMWPRGGPLPRQSWPKLSESSLLAMKPEAANPHQHPPSSDSNPPLPLLHLPWLCDFVNIKSWRANMTGQKGLPIR